jgi:hypothetical protein
MGVLIMKDHLYIPDNKSVQLYSLKEKKFIRFIGKMGIGPGEYMEDPAVCFQFPDKILINSFMNRKLLTFTITGDFIKERRYIFMASRLEPVGSNYVVSTQSYFRGKERKSFNEIVLYDSEFIKIKELLIDEILDPLKRIDVVGVKPSFRIYKDKIYVSIPKDGLVFEIFAKGGKSIGRIQKDYKKVKVPQEYKSKKIAEIKEQKREYWHLLKNTIYFSEYFPALRDFMLCSDKIYARTWIEKGDNTEFIVIDLNGNGVKHIQLPKAGELYTFVNDQYWYLIENMDEETWEIHSLSVDK